MYLGNSSEDVEQAYSHHAVIDWALCLKLANSKVSLAEEMLNMFMEELPESRHAISLGYQEKNYDHLHKAIHKLHGATCYCGLPRLKQILADLEVNLKTKNYQDLNLLMERLFKEMDLLAHVYEQDKFRR